MPEVTIDTIMDWFHDQVEQHKPVGPNMWLDGARKVNALMGNLDEDLIAAEIEFNDEVSQYVSEGETYSAAKTFAKSHDAYKRYLGLKAKKDRAIEFIRLAKKSPVSPQWDA